MPPPNDDFEDDEEKGLLQRHSGLLVAAGLLIFGGAFYFVYKHLSHAGGTSQTKAEEIVMLRLPIPPPPPPPPPPKIPPPPQQQRMIVQEHVEDVAKPPEKPAEPAPNISTGIKGDGPGDFALGSGPGGNGTGTGLGGNYGGGRWGWYASQVQRRISNALSQNTHTRYASLRVKVCIWPDSTGRVTRVQLVDSTGDQGLDSAIKNEVLAGLQLDEPPPQDMPTPIVLRLTMQKQK